MTQPINLNKFRKAKARSEKEQRAVENRIKYGRTKAEKAADRQQNQRLSDTLDGASSKEEDR